MELYLKPVLFASAACLVSFGLYLFYTGSGVIASGRTENIIILAVTSVLAGGLYLASLWLSKYLNDKDMLNLKKLILVINPFGKKAQ